MPPRRRCWRPLRRRTRYRSPSYRDANPWTICGWTVGWRFIPERRAISLDPNCDRARGKADPLYVADAFAGMRKVNELLAK